MIYLSCQEKRLKLRKFFQPILDSEAQKSFSKYELLSFLD